MPDDTTTSTDTTNTDSSPSDTSAASPGADDAPAKAAPRRRSRSSAARKATQPTLDGADGTLDAAAPTPRKRAPRKSAARSRSAASIDQVDTVGQAVAAESVDPLSPAPAADSELVVETAAVVETEPTVDTAPTDAAPTDPAPTAPAPTDAAPTVDTAPAATDAPPARRSRAAAASSGFALLARAAPVFSHSPSTASTAPPVETPEIEPDGLTPESLLAALDAVAPARAAAPPPPVPAAVFVPPIPVFVDPADYWGAPPPADADGDGDENTTEDTTDAGDDTEGAVGVDTDDSTDGDEPETAPGRRRRRRGGRRRRGSADRADEATEPASAEAAGDEGAAEHDEATADSAAPMDEDRPDVDGDGSATSDGEPAEDGADSSDDAAGSRRRRRRRRRGGDDGDAPAVDDPPDTVVRVREPRRTRARHDEADSEITAARGSTRIEAKRQRRRDGREAHKRPPILTEAEFLARRESVARSMLVRELDGRTQIAVLEDGMLVEHYVAEESVPSDRSLIGDVYLGRVQNVLPAMEAAFIDIGRGRNAVLYAGEVDWDGLGMEGKPKRIELALKSGQAVLVQVTKDPIGQKGARLTAQISLAGRYLVLVPNGSMSGISRKLPDSERARLKKILRELLPAKSGVIVRTAAEGASEEELAADVARLTGQWDAISAQAATASAPALLQGEPNLATKVVRDIFNEDFASLVVAGDKVLEQVRSYVGSVAPNLLDRVSPWTSEQDIFTANRVDEQLVKALDRKVFLPSGGSLVIDRTEAMTVVDVNTGRFTGSGGNLEETVTENNLEAAEELVRQLRLRDIGGIIVVDFIDMVFEANRDLVVRRLVECLGRDRTRHQVAEVSSLGLVQMTRKRIGRGLLEVFGHTCEVCRGRGMVVDLNGHANGVDHEPAVATPPRIPNPGNTGRAHLRTIATAIPVGDLPTADGIADPDPAGPADLEVVEVAVVDLATGEVTSDEMQTVEVLDLGGEDPATPDEVDAHEVDAGEVDAVEAALVEILEAVGGPIEPVDDDVPEPGEAEAVDAEAVGAEPGEAEPGDAEAVEAEPVDAEPVDAEPVDAEPVDAEPVDAEPVDAGSTDSTPEDQGEPDAPGDPDEDADRDLAGVVTGAGGADVAPSD